ncbi:hypothetical protein PR048_018183 [Dryococelus australis]|uniref:Uncharacterized protein n=1 Tax=Dryococelus australis TaxID=614101 RepID=A0ABQ9HBK7_9NEOP|nr:hypothetical protein PR048_018183 [Dryococelus australis]
MTANISEQFIPKSPQKNGLVETSATVTVGQGPELWRYRARRLPRVPGPQNPASNIGPEIANLLLGRQYHGNEITTTTGVVADIKHTSPSGICNQHSPSFSRLWLCRKWRESAEQEKNGSRKKWQGNGEKRRRWNKGKEERLWRQSGLSTISHFPAATAEMGYEIERAAGGGGRRVLLFQITTAEAVPAPLLQCADLKFEGAFTQYEELRTAYVITWREGHNHCQPCFPPKLKTLLLRISHRHSTLYSILGLVKQRRRNCVLVGRLLASHLCEPSSIHDGIALGFPHVGIMPDDAAGWSRGFSRHLTSFSSAFKTSLLTATRSNSTETAPTVDAIPSLHFTSSAEHRGGHICFFNLKVVFDSAACTDDDCVDLGWQATRESPGWFDLGGPAQLLAKHPQPRKVLRPGGALYKAGVMAARCHLYSRGRRDDF